MLHVCARLMLFMGRFQVQNLLRHCLPKHMQCRQRSMALLESSLVLRWRSVDLWRSGIGHRTNLRYFLLVLIELHVSHRWGFRIYKRKDIIDWMRKLHAHSRTFRAFQVYLWRYLVGNVARSQACIRLCPNMLVPPCLLHIWAKLGITLYIIITYHNQFITLRYVTLHCIALLCIVL